MPDRPTSLPVPVRSRPDPGVPPDPPPDDAPAPAGEVSDTSGSGWIEAPILAAQFLTIVPPTIRRAPAPGELGRSEAFFPLVGVLLGGLLVAVDGLLGRLVAPMVRDVLIVGMLAILSGALHLDGLADTADGLFGGRDEVRRLDIMRDPRTGSYGVVAVVLVLGLKLAALGSLDPVTRVGALLLAPCLGRWSIVLATGLFPYARPEGLGRAFKDSLRGMHIAIAALTAVLIAVLVAGPVGLVVWAAGGGLVLVLGRWMAARLGGLTGDTYGALCELTEALTLVALGVSLRGVLG